MKELDYKETEIRILAEYCRTDHEITRKLTKRLDFYQNGVEMCSNKPVSWSKRVSNVF